MARKYRLRRQAERDLEEIWQYSARRWSVEQAERYTAQLLDTVGSLVLTPELGRDVGDVRPGLRRVRSGSHFIFYKVAGEQEAEAIEVVRLLHIRMDHIAHLE